MNSTLQMYKPSTFGLGQGSIYAHIWPLHNILRYFQHCIFAYKDTNYTSSRAVHFSNFSYISCKSSQKPHLRALSYADLCDIHVCTQVQKSKLTELCYKTNPVVHKKLVRKKVTSCNYWILMSNHYCHCQVPEYSGIDAHP